MKKFLSLLLILVMLLGVLCSCNDIDKDTNIPSDDANAPSDEDKPSDEANTPSSEDNPSDEVNKPSDNNDEHSNTVEGNDGDDFHSSESIATPYEKDPSLSDRVNGLKAMLYDFATNKHAATSYVKFEWHDPSSWYNTGDGFAFRDDPSYYDFGLIDIDEDGLSEVILKRFDEYYLLYYVDGYVRYEGVSEVMNDGTFLWCYNEYNDFRLTRYKFEGPLLSKNTPIIYLSKATSINHWTPFSKFFIGDTEVTKEEYEQYESQFSNEPLEYFDLTVENIEKYVID